LPRLDDGYIQRIYFGAPAGEQVLQHGSLVAATVLTGIGNGGNHGVNMRSIRAQQLGLMAVQCQLAAKSRCHGSGSRYGYVHCLYSPVQSDELTGQTRLQRTFFAVSPVKR
jgi:hypothetical protein